MITKFEKFKLFESSDSAKYDLIHDFLYYSYIYDYYDEHYLSDYDQSDVVDIIESNPNIISGVFDNDKYIKSIIRDSMNNQNIGDFDAYEYKEYINNHLTREKENKIIELYYDNNDDENMIIKTEYDGIVSISDEDGVKTVMITEDDTTEEYEIPDNFNIVVEEGDEINYNTIIARNDDIEYDSDMIDDLDSDQLKDIITDENEEGEFLEETITKRYEDKTFIEIMEEEKSVDSYEELIDNMTPKKFYEYYSSFIDIDKLVKNYKKYEDSDSKYDWVESKIPDSIEIQHYLMDNSKDSNNLTLLLFEIFEDKGDHSDDISDEYEFQKRYIEEYIKENGYDDSTEDEKGDLIAEALKDLNSNFVLDSQIKTEFNKYMFIVDSDKFNM